MISSLSYVEVIVVAIHLLLTPPSPRQIARGRAEINADEL